jgi:hypothetical protein
MGGRRERGGRVRQLHVLGVSDDGEALLLGLSSGKPTHRLPLDEKLRAVVRGQLSAVSGDRAEITLTPKEIQARLRAGATPEEVAKAAEVPVARVLPYAVPVLAERERIVEQARAAVPHRSRGPAGDKPMGEIVDSRLADTGGLREESVDWTAWRQNDGSWVVAVVYAARGGKRTASWLWQPVARELTALDPAASRLSSATESSARRSAARRSASAKRATKTPRKAATKTTGANRGAAKGRTAAAAGRTATKRPEIRKTAAAGKAAAPAKAAHKTTAARKAAPAKAAGARTSTASAKAAPARTSPARTSPARPTRKQPAAARAQRPAAVVEVAEAVEPRQQPAPPRERRERLRAVPPPPARKPGERVPLPSWSDMLLGVQGPAAEPEHDEAPAPPRRRRRA